jgi:hypothetical protein
MASRTKSAARFAAVYSVALALVPAGAHLLELPNKIGLSAEAYRTVQQIYRGWALLGTVVMAALISTLALAVMERGSRAFVPALGSFLCIVATQVIFWTVTFPVNQATANWTILPGNWQQMRMQWEYSHAVACGIDLIALALVILAVLRAEPSGHP